MKTNREIKNAALAALKGNWALAVVAAICLSAVSTLVAAPSYLVNLSVSGIHPFNTINPLVLLAFCYVSFGLNVLLLYPISIGYAVAHRELYVNGDSSLVRNTFKNAFTGYFRNVLAMLLMYVFVVLWSLLLIVPGIVKSLSYAMTPYIIKDNPELSPNQAINLSMKMMKGYKLKLFWLTLSFIGWIFLCVLTLGIGLLWVMPYMQTTMAAFYEEVKNDYLCRDEIK